MRALRRALLVISLLMSPAFAQAIEFKQGQVWEYKTRPSEANSTLTIVKIDTINDVRIIHIAVQGLQIKNLRAPRGYGEEISHMPMAEESLIESVTRMIRTTDRLPSFQEGYAHWKAAFDKGEGGYFTIPVEQGVEYIERAINQ